MRFPGSARCVRSPLPSNPPNRTLSEESFDPLPSGPHVLGLMTKFWDQGRVKTRLGASIGMREAAALHRAFVTELCQALGEVADRRQVVLDPPERFAEAALYLPGSWELVGQGSGDLGERMERWFSDRLEGETSSRAVLIGSDCLTLGPAEIGQAIAALDTTDVAVGSTADGGYYLIGLRAPWRNAYAALFRNVPWSTPEVFAVTLERAASAGLAVTQLSQQEDVDTIDELRRLRTALHSRAGSGLTASRLRDVIDSCLASPLSAISEPHTPAVSTTGVDFSVDTRPRTAIEAGPTSRPSTIIIGGGVIGLTLAWELLGRGQRVSLLERDRIGRGTSWAASGILPPARLDTATDPLDRLRGYSHALFPKWAAELQRASGLDIGFRRCGGWYLAETPGERASMIGMTGFWRELGIECERQPLEQLGRREPGLEAWASMRPDAAAWWVPDECQVRSPDYLRALAIGVRDRGGELLEGCQVENLRESDAGGEVLVNGTWRRADSVVVCGGAWSGRIAQQFGLQHSLVPVRGQILLLRLNQPPLQSVVNVGNQYLVCRDDGRTLVGSVEEEVGFRTGTTPEVLQRLHDFACRVCPRLADAPVEKSWSGFRPMTFDGFPMIGRIPETRHLYVAAGHFRSGLHLSCGTAVCMADLMMGRQPVVDLAPFRVGKQQQRLPIPVPMVNPGKR